MRQLVLLTGIMIALMAQSFMPDPALTVVSSSFTNNNLMPAKYSCEGESINPPLVVTNIPREAKTLAIIMHDPDAPRAGGFTHWVAWNLSTDGLITEAFRNGDQGLNTAGTKGYLGMCPPSGTHHYHIRVYALDAVLNLTKEKTGKAELEAAMKGHIMAEGMIMGLYKKAKQ